MASPSLHESTIQTIRREIEALSRELDQYRQERVHVTQVLRAFFESPITISSVQPVLALAVELSPELVERAS